MNPDTQRPGARIRGFTLIETLVAVTLLTVAIAAPITLVSKSLATAYYARDQITAFHLAQEGIESVRHIRDRNILYTALNPADPVDILFGILDTDQDSRTFAISTIDDEIYSCDSSDEDDCQPLQIDPGRTFYGYGNGWEDTRFTRIVRVDTVDSELNEVPQEIQVEVTVSWRTGSFQKREVTISENLYRWVRDNTSEEELGEIEEEPEDLPPGERVTIFFTSGSAWWQVPNDWNPADNSIEVVAGGGGGGGGRNNHRSSGGGGGGYAKVTNVSLSGSVRYSVGSGGAQMVAGGDTYFCNSPVSCASISGSAVIVGARGGGAGANTTGSAGGSGGQASSGVGEVRYSGGSGASSNSTQNGGGGGAAGPNGHGATATAGNGGAGGGGSGGVGGLVGVAGSPNGKPGGNGSEWTNSNGASGGSGGGGGATMNGGNTNAGAGGSYGGGGGGADQQFTGGSGGRGVIVISYQPI